MCFVSNFASLNIIPPENTGKTSRATLFSRFHLSQQSADKQLLTSNILPEQHSFSTREDKIINILITVNELRLSAVGLRQVRKRLPATAASAKVKKSS